MAKRRARAAAEQEGQEQEPVSRWCWLPTHLALHTPGQQHLSVVHQGLELLHIPCHEDERVRQELVGSAKSEGGPGLPSRLVSV